MPITDQNSSFLTLLLKYSATAFYSELVSLPRNGSERHSESIFLFFVARKGIPSCVLFRGMVWNGIPRICIYLGPRNGITSCVLFRRRVWNRIMGVCFYFVPRNGIPSCFLFRGRVRNEIPRFSVPRNNRNSVGNNHLFRLFRLPRNYFFVGNSQPYLQSLLVAIHLKQNVNCGESIFDYEYLHELMYTKNRKISFIAMSH
jgi:hypothetical protein